MKADPGSAPAGSPSHRRQWPPSCRGGAARAPDRLARSHALRLLLVSVLVGFASVIASGAALSSAPVRNGIFIVGDGADGFYRLDLSGRTKRLLEGRFGYVADPSWSPDGERIAFIASTDGNNDHAGQWVARQDGTKLRNLRIESDTAAVSCCPAWSPDGHRIAFVESDADNRIGLNIINLATGTTRRIATARSDTMALGGWSSQDVLAFVDGYTLSTIRSDGTRRRKLRRFVPYAPDGFDWSPDGSRIVYEENWHLWTMRSDGSDRRAITRKTAKKKEYGPKWSPDGKSVAFLERDCTVVRGRCTPTGLWTLRLRDGQRKRVSPKPGQSDFAAFDWQPRVGQ